MIHEFLTKADAHEPKEYLLLAVFILATGILISVVIDVMDRIAN